MLLYCTNFFELKLKGLFSYIPLNSCDVNGEGHQLYLFSNYPYFVTKKKVELR